MSLRQQSLRSSNINNKYFSKASKGDDESGFVGSPGDDMEDDDSSFDGSSAANTTRNRSRRSKKGIFATILSFKNYILIMVIFFLGISYLHERSVRIEAVREFTEKMSEKSFQDVYKPSSKAVSPLVVCPKCPQCSNDDTPEVVEKEEEETQADPLEHVKKWDDKHETLTKEIQRLSRSLLQLKFGPPPYYVELEMEVDSESVKGGKVTIEMAPIDLMPYSVYFFLTQVSAGVWNQCRSLIFYF